MPIYSFECQDCGKRFEELCAYDRRDEMRCPTCNGQARILVSSFAVKGSAGAGAPAPASSRFT